MISVIHMVITVSGPHPASTLTLFFQGVVYLSPPAAPQESSLLTRGPSLVLTQWDPAVSHPLSSPYKPSVMKEPGATWSPRPFRSSTLGLGGVQHLFCPRGQDLHGQPQAPA